jgi:penicillin-binding protein 2
MHSFQVERESMERRINIVFWIVVAFFIVFFIGFWYLQVIRGPYYDLLARENIRRDYPLPAPRGLILDRNNAVITENRLSHNLFITPGLSRNLDHTLDFISKTLATSPEELKKTISKEGSLRSRQPVLVYQDLSLAHFAYISARKIEYPELDIKQETKRSYPYGGLFAHSIGYVGELTEEQAAKNHFPEAKKRDIVGQAGLERYYNKYLMGRAGYESKVVNSYGMELKEFPVTRQAAEPGKALRIGIDYNMQKAAMDAFHEKEKYGSVVALNIKTGEVMVMYSDPYYDPNHFIPKIAPAEWRELIGDPRHPLQNRTIQNKFSPGSTFKIVMALAALQEKKITPETSYFCGGSQFIYSRTFRCWKPGGHGYVNLHKAIVQSCDVFFYNLGMKMDIDLIGKYAKDLGLGHITGIDLYNESSGLVPSREWKQKTAGEKWYPGETISVAIGQGPVLVTGLQIASLVATVASSGSMIQPHLLSAVMEKGGKVIDVAKFERKTVTGIDHRNYEIVNQALWGAVNEAGTGTRAKIEGYDVCGKTGTVQVVGFDRGGDLWKKEKEKYGDHAWFVSFAPYSDPQVAVAVFVEHGGHGSDAAAPVAKRIFETYFHDRKILPYEPPHFAPKRKIEPPPPANVAAARIEESQSHEER